MVAGVYAAGTRTFSVNGTVAFTSKLVDATVSVLKADGVAEMEDLDYIAVSGQDAQDINGKDDQELVDFNLGSFTLDDDKIYMGYKVSIQNDDIEAIYVRITAPVGTTDVLTAATPDVSGATLVSGSDYEIAVGATLVVTFTFELDPDNALVDEGQDLGIGATFVLAPTVALLG